MSHSQSVTLI